MSGYLPRSCFCTSSVLISARDRATRSSELAILAVPLVEQALGGDEPSLVAGDRDAELGALRVDIAAQAQIGAENAAGGAGDQHARLDEMAEFDVGDEARIDHAGARVCLEWPGRLRRTGRARLGAGRAGRRGMK